MFTGKKKYGKDTVRKNVTLSAGTVADLEAVSRRTGCTQSELLERALASPRMMRLRAFFNGDSGDCMADLLDCIAGQMSRCGGAQADAAVRTAVLDVLDGVYLPAAVLDTGFFSVPDHVAELNAYVISHLPDRCAGASPYMKSVHDMCGMGMFAIGGSVVMQMRVHDFVEAVRGTPGFLDEPCMYRILACTVGSVYRRPDEDTAAKLFRALTEEPAVFGSFGF